MVLLRVLQNRLLATLRMKGCCCDCLIITGCTEDWHNDSLHWSILLVEDLMKSSVVISFYVKLFNLSVNFQAVEEKHLHCEIHTWMNLAGLGIKHLVYMPIGHMVLKFTCPAKILMCPTNICTSPVKLIYTAEKISTCPDWKITCPVGHVTTKVCAQGQDLHAPGTRSCLNVDPCLVLELLPQNF